MFETLVVSSCSRCCWWNAMFEVLVVSCSKSWLCHVQDAGVVMFNLLVAFFSRRW